MARITTVGNKLSFMCPGCHSIHCLDLAKWQWNQDENLPTISPSINVRIQPTDSSRPVKICHSFICNGKIEFLSDSTHHLANQTVDLLEIQL